MITGVYLVQKLYLVRRGCANINEMTDEVKSPHYLIAKNLSPEYSPFLPVEKVN